MVLGGVALAWLTGGCASSGVSERYEDLTQEYGEESRTRETARAEIRDDLLAGEGPLQRAALVEAVLARNPSLESARQGWRAALARYDQATAWTDPVLRYELAPASIGSDDVRFGQSIQLSQSFSFPGKRGLRGAVALAEAEAAREDYEAVRVRLAAMASTLFDDYYFLQRSREINAEHIRLLGEYRRIATARYGSGTASQEEPLSAEVEAAHLTHRQMQLDSALEVTRAQINALLHRPSSASVPPAPARLSPPAELEAGEEELMARARENRPELRALEARIRGFEASVDLAGKESWPDLDLMAEYNSMWAQPEHQWMVGVRLNLPLFGARGAAREEARARLARTRSEHEEILDTIHFDVARAAERVRESKRIADLFQNRLLPASRDEVAAARAGFEAGRTSFLTLIQTQRNLRDVEMAYEEAITDYHRNRAELARALGLPGALEPEGDRP
jgi:outer membrane protein TolC